MRSRSRGQLFRGLGFPGSGLLVRRVSEGRSVLGEHALNANQRTGDPRRQLRDESSILPSRPATLRAAWLFSRSFAPFGTPTGRRGGGGSKGTLGCSFPGGRCSWPRCPQSVVSGGHRACFRPLEVQATASRYRTISQSQASQSSHEAGVGAMYLEHGSELRCSDVATIARIVPGSGLLQRHPAG